MSTALFCVTVYVGMWRLMQRRIKCWSKNAFSRARMTPSQSLMVTDGALKLDKACASVIFVRPGVRRWNLTRSAYHSCCLSSARSLVKGKGKGAYSSLWIGNPSQSYGASPATRDRTVLPATRHRWTRPALTPAMQAGTRFTYPGGMEGW